VRSLVELIVLNVGLTAGILNTRLFSMYVIEALLLTSLTSPLVSAIYPVKYHTKIANGQIVGPGSKAKTHEEGDTDDGKDASESRHSLAYEEDDEASWKTRFLAVLDKAETLPALYVSALHLILDADICPQSVPYAAVPASAEAATDRLEARCCPPPGC